MLFNFSDYILASVWIAGILKVEELPQNSTFNFALNCGINNCPETQLPDATSEPSIASIYNLFFTLVVATLIAIFISLVFVDDLNYDEDLNQMDRQNITVYHISKN